MIRHLLVLLGFFAVLLLAGAALAGERRPGELNEDFAPVAAYGLTDEEGRPTGMIVLQSGRFHCPKGDARAVWFEWANGVAVIGCWRDQGAKYVAEFEDNDRREFEKREAENIDIDRIALNGAHGGRVRP